MYAEKFANWLNAELDRRGWSRSEAARRGEISASALDKVINGYANPGLEFCRGISRAFGMPMEDILHLAGILPPPTAPPAVRERRIVYEVNGEETLLGLWRALSVEDQALVRDLLVRLAPTRIVG